MAQISPQMDLRKFIEESITQILDGIRNAGENAKSIESSAVVNPRKEHHFYSDPEKISFDIAITVIGSQKGEGGARIKVLGVLDGGIGSTSSLDHQTVSRIKFDVPIALPSTPKRQYEPQQAKVAMRGRAFS